MKARSMLMTTAMLVAVAAHAREQTAGVTAEPPKAGTQTASSIPDFSGTWSHPYIPAYEPPRSGSGPVTNRVRVRQAFGDDGRPLPRTSNMPVSNISRLVGDYTNPILKPEAAEILRKRGEDSLAGRNYLTPSNQCWPWQMPYIFENLGVEVVQQPDKVTILYPFNHELRQIRLNVLHPAKVTPSWYGDSVGHYEGETLVIDTVGIKVGLYTMADWYGTPQSDAMHVVERYRLIDYDTAREYWDRNAKENFRIPSNDGGAEVDYRYRGKVLQLEFTVEDEGVFTTPWSATVTYWRGLNEPQELVCSENPHEYYAGKDSTVPMAARPDF